MRASGNAAGGLWALTIAFQVLLGGCRELPDEVYSCEPSDPSTCPGGFVCRPFQCPADYRCYQRVGGERRSYPRGCVQDGICDAASCESCFDCPGDCCPTCDEEALAAAPGLTLLVRSYRVPDDPLERESLGLDLDHDGLLDNRLGNLKALFAFLLEDEGVPTVNEGLATLVADGQLELVLRLHRGVPGAPGQGLAQVLLAEVEGGAPAFDGTDRVMVASDASVGSRLCGRTDGEAFDSRPTTATIRFPLPVSPDGTEAASFTLHGVRLQGTVDEDGFGTLLLGGTLTTEQLDLEYWPAVATAINRRVLAEPDGPFAEMAGFMDGACESIPGCESERPGEGECTTSSPPALTATELRCNWLMHAIWKANVDADGDGVPERYGIGVQLDVVPAILAE